MHVFLCLHRENYLELSIFFDQLTYTLAETVSDYSMSHLGGRYHAKSFKKN